MILIRDRSSIDNRHYIRNPYGLGEKDMAIWTNTMLKERVATLFRTEEGLKGHALQIEGELNRLAHVEGQSGKSVTQAMQTAKYIKASIKKAKKDAPHVHFKGDIIINIKILKDCIKL